MLSSDLTEKRREGGSAAAAAQGNGSSKKKNVKNTKEAKFCRQQEGSLDS